MRPLIAILLLALPIAEIAAFIVVGSQIGVLATIGLILASSVAGAMLLRFQGFGAMQRLRAAVERGEAPGRESADGAMIALAGLLLITPGFITGVLGLLLFLPPVRQLFWKLADGKARAGIPGGAARGQHRAPPDGPERGHQQRHAQHGCLPGHAIPLRWMPGPDCADACTRAVLTAVTERPWTMPSAARFPACK